MLKPSLRPLFKLSSLVINLQLFLSPMAFAADADGKIGKRESNWNTVSDVVGMTSKLMLNAATAYTQGNQNQSATQLAQFKMQLEPSLRLTPVDQTQIPGVFNGCLVLPASGAQLTGGASCNGADPGKINAGYADAILDIAEFNKQQLTNFTTTGHERYTTQGVGCYDKKIEDFKSLMDSREESLTKMARSLDTRIQNFKNSQKALLEQVKKDNALLTGKPARLAKKEALADMFIGAGDKGNVCASFIGKTQIEKSSGKGLNAINDAIFKTAYQGKGGMNPDELLSNARAMEVEVTTIGAELGKISARRGGLSMPLNAIKYSSKLSKTLMNSISAVSKKYESQTQNELDTLKSELNLDQATASNPAAKSIYANLSKVNSSKINLEERLNNLELKTKADCFNGLLSQFGGASGFARKFSNPTVSRSLNGEADNPFATAISNEISKGGDLDALVSAIETEQQDGLNDKKVFIPGKSFKVNGISYGASTPLQASSLVRIFANNCKKSYTSSKNADGVTTAQLVKDLRSYGVKRDNLRKKAPARIQALLKNEIVNCTSDKSTGVNKMSCSSKDLDSGSSNFCIRTAKACATNMNGCIAKSKAIVKTAKDRQAANAKTYDDTFKAVKLAMSNELQKLETFFEGQARSVDGKLNLGTMFKTPEEDPFKMDIDLGFNSKEQKELGGEYDLQDPDKLLAMAKKKVAGLKTALATQKKELIVALTKKKALYTQNYKAQIAHWSNVINECNGRNNQVAEMINKENEKTLADQELIDTACMEIEAYNQSGDCEGIGSTMETVQKAVLIASKQGGNGQQQQQGQYSRYDTGRTNQAAYSQLQQIKYSCGKLDGKRAMPLPLGGVESYCENMGDTHPTCKPYRDGKATYSKVCTGSLGLELAKKLGLATEEDKICSQGTWTKADSTGNCPTATGSTYPGVSAKDVAANSTLRDAAIALAGCYEDIPHSKWTKILDDIRPEAVAAHQVQDMQAMGESRGRITPAMCNASYNGQFDSGDGQILNELANAVGNSMRVRKE